jgi:hypothetical protein
MNRLTLKNAGNFLLAGQLLACQEQQSMDLVTIYDTLFYSNPLPTGGAILGMITVCWVKPCCATSLWEKLHYAKVDTYAPPRPLHSTWVNDATNICIGCVSSNYIYQCIFPVFSVWQSPPICCI